MSEISKQNLEKEINDILKTADLSVISSKKIREQLESKLGVSLVSRKKEVDEIVMKFINNESESDAEVRTQPKSRKAPVRKRGKYVYWAHSDSGSNCELDEDYIKPKKTKAKKGKAVGTDSDSCSDDGSDEDYKEPKKANTKKAKNAGKGRKGTGFTRPYTLSPELAAIMGAESLPRHEVVKKVWSIIKERNLYDPKNKQFAICDEELLKVMKVKRFRTFGMLKYLKPHFIN